MIKTESMIKTEVKPLPFTPVSASTGSLSASLSAAGGDVGANSTGKKHRRSSAHQLKAKAKAVVLRCWRNRMSPIQFSIELKKMISDESNRGGKFGGNNNNDDCTGENSQTTKKASRKDVFSSGKSYVGDAFDLAEILFRQGFCGQAPNRLILSYMSFCLGGGVISFKETLRLATSSAGGGSGGGSPESTAPAVDISRPECLKASLQLVETFAHCLLNEDKAGSSVENCLENARIVAKTVDWIVGVLERVVASTGKIVDAGARSLIEACFLALKRVVEDEPALAALAKIGVLDSGADVETRISRNVETILKSPLASSSSSTSDGSGDNAVFPKTFQSLLSKTSTLASTPMASKLAASIHKKERGDNNDDDDAAVALASRHDAKKSGKQHDDASDAADSAAAASGGPLEDKTLTLPISALTFVDVVLHPYAASSSSSSKITNAGNDVLAQILALEKILRVSRARVVAQLVRAAFLGIVDAKDNEGAIAEKCLGDGHRGSGEELKWFAFLMLKLPEMLREMSMTSTADATPPKAAIFKGLRLFLASTSLVDLADRKAQADTALLFLQQLTRPKYGVITEEERTELLKRRFHGNNPNISEAELSETHRVVKGERTCESIISTISQELSHNVNEAPILGVMSHMGSGESIKVIFAAAAATGKLPLFVSQVVKLNEHCRNLNDPKASAGAACLSFPVLLDRALLYDLSFSTLCYIVLLYGPGVSNDARDGASHAHILQWIRAHFPSNARPKNVEGGSPAVSESSSSSSSSSPDSLLQQLMSTNGVSLSPPHSRLSDLVDATPFAMRDLVCAFESGAINDDLVMSCLEKLKAFSCLPIAAAAWLIAYVRLLPADRTEKPTFMLKQLLAFGPTPPGSLHKDFAKYYAERTRIAHQVLTRLHHDLTAPHVANFKVDPFKTAPHDHRASSSSSLKGGNDYGSKTASGGPSNNAVGSPSTSADVLKAIFQNCISRGWVDIRDTHHLHRMLQVGGCRWFSDQVVDLLLSQFYQNDIMMSTNLLSSWFCLRREALTACLVGETIPALLDRGRQGLEGGVASSATDASQHTSTVQNPHAFALARLTVLCLVATLVDRGRADPKSSKSPLKRKSLHEEADLSSSVRCQPTRKRIALDPSAPFPLSRLVSTSASAFPLPSSSLSFSRGGGGGGDDDEDDFDAKSSSFSDVKVKVEGAVVDASRAASGVSGASAQNAVDEDAFHSALTAMFDAFLRVLDRGTVDSRILFIHEFLTQLLQTRYCDEILPFVPVRLVSKLLSTIPRELSADVVAKLNHLQSPTGRGVAASLLHVFASVL